MMSAKIHHKLKMEVTINHMVWGEFHLFFVGMFGVQFSSSDICMVR